LLLEEHASTSSFTLRELCARVNKLNEINELGGHFAGKRLLWAYGSPLRQYARAIVSAATTGRAELATLEQR